MTGAPLVRDSPAHPGWAGRPRPRLRMHEVLEAAARATPEADAVVTRDERYTFGEFQAYVASIAAQLAARGVGPGTRVAVLVNGSADGAGLLYAVSAVGAVAVPLNPYWVEREVAGILGRARCSFLVACAGRAREVVQRAAAGLPGGRRPVTATLERGVISWAAGEATPERAGDPPDIAVLLFTSGSTGAPKGALLTHWGLVGVAHYLGLAMEIGPRDRNLLLLQLYHVGGLVEGLLCTHLHGGACVLLADFDPVTVLLLLEREQVTVTSAFSELFEKLKAVPGYSPDAHRSLRKACVVGGVNAFDALRANGIERLHPAYGLTESCSLVTFARPWQPEERQLSAGVPLPGVELRIADPESGRPVAAGAVGEIRFRGWNGMRGYLDDESGIDADGFVRTGDLGSLGPNGALTYRGRLKRMVKSGGENVSEYEVETFIAEVRDDVEQAAVVGVPDPQWGEMVVAFVQLQDGAELEPAVLRAACKAGLAGYKVPRRFWLLGKAEWPMLPTGKTDKGALERLAVARIATE